MSGRDAMRVDIVYPHLPHYRFGVFAELVRDPRLNVRFIADSRERSGTIETIPFSELPTERVTNRYFGVALWQKGLLAAIRRGRPQAVVFLGDTSHLSTWVAAIWLRLRRVPVFYWTIGWHRPEAGVKRAVRLTFYRLAKVLLLYGDVAKEIGVSLGYPRGRMVRVGNSRSSSAGPKSLGAEQRAELADRLRGVAPNVVAAVVRLNASKRLDLLVGAAGQLVANGVNVTLLIVGDGPERRSLGEQAHSLGVDARFLGALYSEEALEMIYEASDVTVLPSAAGLTVIQSMEHGTPVITHDDPYRQMPESEAIRAGVTGALYRQGDVTDLAKVMSEWFGGAARNPEVAGACVAEVQARWSSQSQASAIAEAILKERRSQ